MNISSIKAFNINPISFKANPIQKEQAKHIDDKFKSANSIDIFCHASTDEDSFNSAKALYLYLEKMGKSPRIIATDEPYNFQYSKKDFNIINFDNINGNTQKADLATCVDFSNEERIPKDVLKYLKSYDNENIVGFDHHNCCKEIIPDTRFITQQYKSISDIPKADPTNYYVDSSAKSCSAIIYRFFESLNIPMSKTQLKSIFCGMSDDMRKSGFLDFNGKTSLKYTPKFVDDQNTEEIYSKVQSKLQKTEKDEVVSHLNILSTLSSDEKAFQKKLFDSVKITSNGKFAYVELSPDDEQWLRLGADNRRTSAILGDFRIRLLNNNENDKIIPKQLKQKAKDVAAVAVFYSLPDENIYKMSIHSKKDYARKYNEYIKENLYPNLTAGGHSNRGGGRIYTLDKSECHNWVTYFKKAAENIEY